MKILLTSTGLSTKKIQDRFFTLLPKPVSECVVAFIPTASRTPEERIYSNRSETELLEAGILENNIVHVELENMVDMQKIESADIIYVCGGNTFYLLQQMNTSGFTEWISSKGKSNKLYIGVSAGSVVAGPTVELLHYLKDTDQNDCGLENFDGLGLTECLVCPHYSLHMEDDIQKFEKEYGKQVERISDSEALLDEGNKNYFLI